MAKKKSAPKPTAKSSPKGKGTVPKPGKPSEKLRKAAELLTRPATVPMPPEMKKESIQAASTLDDINRIARSAQSDDPDPTVAPDSSPLPAVTGELIPIPIALHGTDNSSRTYHPTGTYANKVQRREQALRLRIAGNSYRDIAVELGVSFKTAFYDVQEALAYTHGLEVKQAQMWRQLQLERYEAIILCAWPDVQRGDFYAGTLALKAMDGINKLVGLDKAAEIADRPGVPSASRSLRELPSPDLIKKLDTIRRRLNLPLSTERSNQVSPAP